jgi:glucan phosphoethanolaminetransferase (alkaline phosphatase superfamily)
MKKIALLLFLLTVIYLIGFFCAFPYLLQEYEEDQLVDLIRNIFEYSIMYLSLNLFISIFYKNKFTRVISYILILLISINFVLAISAALIYKSGVNIGMMLSIFDTNIHEAASMSYMFIIPSIIGILVFILNLYTVNILHKKITVNWKTLFLSLLWVMMPFTFFLKHKYISNKGGGKMIKNVFYLSNYLNETMQIRSEAAEMSKIKPNFKLEKIDKGVPNIVLIIGESARKQNFSLYGYSQTTTPFEDKERDNMLVFNNAISPAGITNLSVPLVLSTMEPKDFKKDFKKIAYNIINLSNQAGYNTSWISMQGTARGITSIANSSNYKKWLNGYDEESVKKFTEMFAKKTKTNNFVVIHLNGSHPNPCDRIPPSEAKNNLTCYDQSIRYTDKLLGELFQFSRNRNTVIIYISDHGVKMLDNKFLHVDSKESTQVPFFVWYSNDVDAKYRDIGTIEEETQTTLVFPMIMKFMGLKTPKNYKNKKLEYLKLDLTVIPYEKVPN